MHQFHGAADRFYRYMRRKGFDREYSRLMTAWYFNLQG